MTVHLLAEGSNSKVLCGQPNFLFADPYPWIVDCKKCLHILDRLVEKTVTNRRLQ